MALAAAGDHSADAAALTYLHAQQLPDGGFAYQNSSPWGPPVSDPDSDAIVLQALVAAGEDPESSSWLVGSSSVLTHLRSTQGTDGGFAYPGTGESAFTTSQVPAALMRVAVRWGRVMDGGSGPACHRLPHAHAGRHAHREADDEANGSAHRAPDRPPDRQAFGDT